MSQRHRGGFPSLFSLVCGLYFSRHPAPFLFVQSGFRQSLNCFRPTQFFTLVFSDCPGQFNTIGMEGFQDLSAAAQRIGPSEQRRTIDDVIKDWERHHLLLSAALWDKFQLSVTLKPEHKHKLFDRPPELEVVKLYIRWRVRTADGRVDENISDEALIREWRGIARAHYKLFPSQAYTYGEREEMEKVLPPTIKVSLCTKISSSSTRICLSWKVSRQKNGRKRLSIRKTYKT
jgi:hypothetical protein